MTDTDLERRLRELRITDMARGAAGQRLDTGRAWREFRLLRSRRGRNLRRGLTVGVALAVAAAVVVVVPIFGGSPSAVPGHGQRSEPSTRPSTRPTGRPGPVRAYPGAVAARIPLSGVVSLVANTEQAWAVRTAGPAAAARFQLARIDLRTNKVTLRSNLGQRSEAPGQRPEAPAVALGGGALWLTTSFGRARGQVARIDPASGRVVSALHLPAGRCGWLAYAGGQLWTRCEAVRGRALDFFRVDPATGQVNWRAGPALGQIGSMAVAPQSVWYMAYNSGVYGLIDQGGRARAVTVHDRAFPVSFAYTEELVSGEGAIWAIATDESIARIDPATGRVVRFYTYRSYDPGYSGGLAFLAVGPGSLWGLDDGYLYRGHPFSGVLRVSMATGRPLGRVNFAHGFCGQPCSQIFATPGAVWVPTAQLLIRIDPSRLPG